MKELAETVFFIAMVITLIYSSALVGYNIGQKKMQVEAVERGYGEYHPETGEWQWKEGNK